MDVNPVKEVLTGDRSAYDFLPMVGPHHSKQEYDMHPVDLHIHSLSQRLLDDLQEAEHPDSSQVVEETQKVCGSSLSWLVPRVAVAALRQTMRKSDNAIVEGVVEEQAEQDESQA